jgi:hypothetical protein
MSPLDSAQARQRRSEARIQSFAPPSTWIVWPVIQRASPDAGKATAPVMSPGSAIRLSVWIPSAKASRLGLGEARHVGPDLAGRPAVDPYSARAQRDGKVLDERVDDALGRRVGRQDADGGTRERRQQITLHGFRNASVGCEDVESLADDRADLVRKL